MNYPGKNKKILVMGLGLFGGGVGLVKFLVRSGARVTVTDIRKESELQESLSVLKDLPITYKLGAHQESDFSSADLIFVNPAIPKDSPYLRLAQKHGVPLDTEMNLFFRLCPGPIIGITGTNGKTTTTALVGAILKKSGRRIWVGGNIGGESLLNKIDDSLNGENIIRNDDPAVLELSSFQLEDLSVIQKSPRLSVVLNLRPNHLDRHRTMVNYINAKKNIIRYQSAADDAILNFDDAEIKKWGSECAGQTVWFSRYNEVSEGAFFKGGVFYLKHNGRIQEICSVNDINLLGEFNRENILAAIAVAGRFGVTPEQIRETIREFKGVEHRLELVAEINGVKYYNDSIATNPDSTIAALEAINSPIILIAGGSDKNLPFDKLAQVMAQRAKTVILMGATAEKIEFLLKKQPNSPEIIRVVSLEEAVRVGRVQARSGETVLLSPACASYDLFRNFAERGNLFKSLVNELRDGLLP